MLEWLDGYADQEVSTWPCQRQLAQPALDSWTGFNLYFINTFNLDKSFFQLNFFIVQTCVYVHKKRAGQVGLGLFDKYNFWQKFELFGV